MSLYGYLSLNPSVIPSVKSSEQTPRHHAVASFQTKCIVRRRYGRYLTTEYYSRYIPTVSSMELVRWYIPSDFETEFSPSVIPLVIPLVFSGFLVVIEDKTITKSLLLLTLDYNWMFKILSKLKNKERKHCLWTTVVSQSLEPILWICAGHKWEYLIMWLKKTKASLLLD
jgi:hypothetical protein